MAIYTCVKNVILFSIFSRLGDSLATCGGYCFEQVNHRNSSQVSEGCICHILISYANKNFTMHAL